MSTKKGAETEYLTHDDEISPEMVLPLANGISLLRAAGILTPADFDFEPVQPEAYKMICKLAGVPVTCLPAAAARL